MDNGEWRVENGEWRIRERSDKSTSVLRPKGEKAL